MRNRTRILVQQRHRSSRSENGDPRVPPFTRFAKDPSTETVPYNAECVRSSRAEASLLGALAPSSGLCLLARDSFAGEAATQ